MAKDSDPAKGCLLRYYLVPRGTLNRIKKALNRQKILVLLITSGLLLGFPTPFHLVQEAGADLDLVPLTESNLNENLPLLQKNSLLPISLSVNPDQPVAKLLVVVTAYSSSPWETDDTPYITAAGTQVRDGIVANNYLPIGTKIRIPELFGDKIFVVEDRMHWTMGNYHIDIWFPSYWEALNFGTKITYIEILEN